MNNDLVVSMVKDVLLKVGEFPPSVFVEWDHGGQENLITLGIPQRAQADNAQDRAYMNFLAGRMFAQKWLKKKAFRRSKITGIYDVCEAWSAPYDSTSSHVSPRNHPQRIEVVSITALDVHRREQIATVYEILRDGSGNLSDLLECGVSQSMGSLLYCFLAGTQTARQDMSQAIHSFRQTFERYMAEVPEC